MNKTNLYPEIFKDLSIDQKRKIRDFANQIGYVNIIESPIIDNLVEVQDQYYDLFYTFDKYKRASISNDKMYEKRIHNKKEILKILDNQNFKDIVKLFLSDGDANFVLTKLDDIKNEFENYKYGDQLAKNITDEESKNDKIMRLSDVRILKKLSPKNSKRFAIEAYKEVYRMIFKEANCDKHNNVTKLRELINYIFEIKLKDDDIKQDNHNWWY